ncbi:hypothetical protein PY093_02505 [Cytobacillus sp. S13-E01]|uniref:hypothetical protein n=1 Tax=Cytobacillus sp. S13-E01 TaxID=3031326 RepID=UPI0023D7EF48|nr:hypothetical protein [Cytobacillus sp. S13-E01]MDF0725584.1 hypothetical protein [Cytobacillus sp. S13-E01]
MSNKIKSEINKIPIPPGLHKKSIAGVQQAKLEQRKKFGVFTNRKKILAAVLAGLLLFSATFFHTEVLAAVKRALQFVPGLGLIHEEEMPVERYILQKPVTLELDNGRIMVTGMMIDEKMTLINVVGYDTPLRQNIKIVNEKGNEYKEFSIPSSQTLSGSKEWIASYWHDGKLDITEEAQIILEGKQDIIIPLTLEKAKSYESYTDMGEISTINSVEIVAIPQRVADKLRISLISQHPKDFRISDYGLFPMYAREQMISVQDSVGKEYEIENSPGISAPVSEFYFQLAENEVENYVITLPEIYVVYSDEQKVTLPIPETEADLNESFTLSGFPVQLTKVERIEEDRVRVYVDVQFDEQNDKQLRNFRIKEMGHMVKVSDGTGEILYLEFDIEPIRKKIKVTFQQPEVILKGPWKFEFPVERYFLK